MIIAVFGLSGCATSKRSVPLAPSPPELRFSTLYQEQNQAEIERYLIQKEVEKEPLSPKEALALVSGLQREPLKSKGFEEDTSGNDRCRIQDRFDRKAVLAYEWGRNRVSLDFDGLNFGGSDERAFKLEYRLRLQPEKPKKELCRYKSSWQGLIGSGVNEFFIREEDTIYQEFREYRQKVKAYLDERL